MRGASCILAAGLCLLPDAFAGDPEPAPAPKAGERPDEPDKNTGAAGAAWSIGTVNFSALADGYYSLSFNHPASTTNQLRNFDVKAGQFSLNMAKLTMERLPEPLGFRLDLGFGRAFDIMHGAGKAPGLFRNIEQAYVSFKPAKARGLQVDVGKYVTWAGAEVLETDSNWNYSRSLLFAWAIPYYHFGVRATMPLNAQLSAGVQVTDGWNNVERNSGRTAGFIGTITTAKFTWTHTYFAGEEKHETGRSRRRLYDTTLTLTPRSRASFYINFDYGLDKRAGTGGTRWVGVAGAARVALNGRFALAPRIEWFNDADGFTTGTSQKLKEFTVTGELKVARGLLARLEYRRDWSNVPFFDRGSTPASCRDQKTLLAGFVACFCAKR